MTESGEATRRPVPLNVADERARFVAEAVLPFLAALRAFGAEGEELDAPRQSALEAVLATRARALFADRQDTLMLAVTRTQVLLYDEPIAPDSETVRVVAGALRSRFVAGLQIASRVRPADLMAVVRLLAADRQEVARQGGPAWYLRDVDGGRIRILALDLEGDETVSEEQLAAERMGAASGISSGGCTPIDLVLAEPASARRLARVCRRVPGLSRGHAPYGRTVELFRRLFQALIDRHPETEFSVDRVRGVVDVFLELLEWRLGGQPESLQFGRDETIDESVARLIRFALDLKENPGAETKRCQTRLRVLLAEKSESDLPPLQAVRGARGEYAGPAYRIPRLGLKVRDEIEAIPFSAEVFRYEMSSFPIGEAYLAVHYQLLLAASDAHVYEERREHLLQSIRSGVVQPRELAEFLQLLNESSHEPPCESRDALLSAVMDSVSGDEVVAGLLQSLAGDPAQMQAALDRLVETEHCFSRIGRMIVDPDFKPLMPRLCEAFLTAARRNPESLLRWAQHRPAAFFRPEVFRVFMQLDLESVRRVTDPILDQGPETVRYRLVRALGDEGGRKSRDLLLVALRPGGPSEESGVEEAIGDLLLGLGEARDADAEILEALGGFRDPLVTAVLREALTYANQESYAHRTASAVVNALKRIGTEETLGLLKEVVQSRNFVRRNYRRELRELARAALEAKAE